MADTAIPLKISIAPFPEGFSGDMDETFQQAALLMSATVQGAFLTGLILPPGSTLPTTDQGPIAMGGVWYFFSSVTNSYQPQSSTGRPAKNYCKNSGYNVQQTGAAPALSAGVNPVYDMTLCRMTTSGVLTVAADVGPLAGPDYDTCPAAIKYTCANTSATLGATDIYAHEHLIEGADLASIQNEILSLSFLVWVNQAGVYSAYLASTGRDESYCFPFTITTPNVWTRIKIQGIPAIPSTGTWTYTEGATGMYIGIVMACGSQWKTANTGQWNSGLFMAGTNQSNMVSVANNQMKITAVRLEASTQCGYAAINSFDADLQDCQRYYFTTFNYQSLIAGMQAHAVAYAANSCIFSFLYPRRMAKVPTVVPYSNATTPVAGNVTNISTSTSYANASLTTIGNKGLYAQPATLTAAAGQVLSCYFTADARLT